MGTGVSYGLSSVTKAVLNVEGNKVTISTLPVDTDNLNGQQLYVKAVFTKNNSTNDKAKIPYNITASLGDINGKWISRDTVIFDLGTYGSVQEFSQNYKFAGLTPSDYKITWSLVYGGKDENNIAGNVISNKVE